jgi:hypothetical protein
MPVVCRLLEFSSTHADSLVARPGDLVQSVESIKIHSDVHRYWHAIEFLLSRHRPESPAAKWLGLGQPVSTGIGEIPAARVLMPAEVVQLDTELREIEPDDLIPYFEADDMDKAGVYPKTWKQWEETFDPLGQVLEHYSFLREFVRKCASAGDALLLYFLFVDDGSMY